MKLIKYYEVDCSTRVKPLYHNREFLKYESEYGKVSLKEKGYVNVDNINIFKNTQYTLEPIQYDEVGLKGYEIVDYDKYLLIESNLWNANKYVKKEDLGIKDN